MDSLKVKLKFMTLINQSNHFIGLDELGNCFLYPGQREYLTKVTN